MAVHVPTTIEGSHTIERLLVRDTIEGSPSHRLTVKRWEGDPPIVLWTHDPFIVLRKHDLFIALHVAVSKCLVSRSISLLDSCVFLCPLRFSELFRFK